MASRNLLLSLTFLAVVSTMAGAQTASPSGGGAMDLARLLQAESTPRAAIEAWLAGEVTAGRGRAAAALLIEAGAARLRDGDAATAVDLLEVGGQADPASGAAFSMLGRARSQLRDYEAAEAALREAVARGDANPTTLVFLGAAQWENGRLEEAEATYRRAVEASGRQALPLAQLGRLLLWRGRYEEAVPALTEALARQPRAVEVHLDLAEALRGAGRRDEAIAAFEAVVRAAPDQMKARYGLARLLAQRGDTEASREHFAAYQQLYQADQKRALADEAWKGALDLARHRLDQGKAQAALDGLVSLPATVEVLDLRSLALIALGRNEEALAALQQAVVLDPGRSELRRRLGDLRSRVTGGR